MNENNLILQIVRLLQQVRETRRRDGKVKKQTRKLCLNYRVGWDEGC